MASCCCSICLNELGYLSKSCIVPRLHVLGCFPDIIVIRQKLLPMIVLALSDGIVILLRRSLCRILQIFNILSHTPYGTGSISPVRVHMPQLCEVMGPPPLCIW